MGVEVHVGEMVGVKVGVKVEMFEGVNVKVF